VFVYCARGRKSARVLCALTSECVCFCVEERVCVLCAWQRESVCCVRGREYLLIYVCSVSVADASIRPLGRCGAEHEIKAS
jgi:hypothetical protein